MVAVELVGPGAAARWRALLGPTDPERARAEAPGTIRAAFGPDITQNAVHGSDSPASAARELDLFYGPGGAAFGRCGGGLGGAAALAVIKPHLVAEGRAWQVLDSIQVGRWQRRGLWRWWRVTLPATSTRGACC